MKYTSPVRMDLPITGESSNFTGEVNDELGVIYGAARALHLAITDVYGFDPAGFNVAQKLELLDLYSATALSQLKVRAIADILPYRALSISDDGGEIGARHTSGNAALDSEVAGFSTEAAAAGEFLYLPTAPAIVALPFDVVPGMLYYGWIDGTLITDPYSVPILPSGNATYPVFLAVGRRAAQLTVLHGALI